MSGRTLAVVLSIAVILVVVGAVFLSTVTSYDPLSLIVALGALATVVGLIYRVTGESATRSQGNGARARETSEPRENDTSSTSEENSDVQRIGATAGLTPGQKRLQNELIEFAFDEFADDPFAFMLTYQAPHLVSEVADRAEADEDEVRAVWKFCRDDGFFRKRGKSWRMTPKAVFRAEELGMDVELDEDTQTELLDALLQEYRSDPHRPKVRQETLIEALGQTRDIVVLNLWYLCEKGYVERESYIGGNPEYQITDRGRRAME